jgi:TonB family protein
MPLAASDVDLSYSEARPMPNYPRQAAIDCVEGEVLARFTVSETLEPENVQILRSTPNGVFEQVVLDALDRWLVNAEPGTELEKLFEFNLGKDGCAP